MNIFFKPSFIKDFKKLPSRIRREVRHICVDIFPNLKNLQKLRGYEIKPVKGFKGYYRIRLGFYRVGFKATKKGIEFMRVKHRKDVYRQFP